MKSAEIYLKDILGSCIDREIVICEDDYSRFDCIDNKKNIYELKVRTKHYDEVMIEFDKFSYNLMYVKEFKMNKFLYVVEMKEVGYVFDIKELHEKGYDFGWESRDLPKNTEFKDKRTIKKMVGFIHLENATYIFDVK